MEMICLWVEKDKQTFYNYIERKSELETKGRYVL